MIGPLGTETGVASSISVWGNQRWIGSDRTMLLEPERLAGSSS